MDDMQRDRLREATVFVTSVAEGGVSAGARRLGLPPSSVSRTLQALERRLGVTLLVRGPRLFRLTAEGEALYERARRLLTQFDEMERAVSDRGLPKGQLRVSMSVAFGRIVVLPLLARFRMAYPEISLDLSFSDRFTDLAGGEADVALRVGPLIDSELTALKLAHSPRILVAAPAYLERFGRPATPADVMAHECLRFKRGRTDRWLFEVDERPVEVEPRGAIEADDGDSLAQLAMSGHGIARLGRFHVREAIEDGRLSEVLGAFRSNEADEVHALFASGRSAPERVRVFVDYLARNIEIEKP